MPFSPEVRRERRENRKSENRQRWEASRENANVRQREALAAIDLNTDKSVAALDALRDIMLDGEVPVSRRLKAAASILRYEIPPGGLLGRERDQITSTAYQFFAAVAASDVGEEHRQFALEQMLLVEEQKARAIDADAVAEQRDQWIMAINARRREPLAHAHAWPECPSHWWLSPADDVELPELPGSAESLDELLALGEDEIRRRADARQRQLLAVEARNRDDRSWRAVLKQPK